MRTPHPLNDYITRREAHALIVRVINEVFAQMAKADPSPETVPTNSEGAESCD